MDPITQQQALAAAGAAGEDSLYVEDVFSIDLYSPSSTTTTVTNGIDFAGEGGMVFRKRIDTAQNWTLHDTERGDNKILYPNLTDAEQTSNNVLTSGGFTSTGLVWDTGGHSGDVVNFSFRKCPGFFDVVTYTGNGTAGRQISHNLGSVPGFIIVKELSTASNWICYHRSLGNGYAIYLNSDQPQDGPNKPVWNLTNPTSTHFTVASNGWNTNDTGTNYVAYVFAHNEPVFGTNEDEAIIKCDTYVGNGGSQTINVGFEPQFLIVKRASGPNDWFMFDTVRGHFVEPGDSKILRPNQAYAQSNYSNAFVDSTGFRWTMSDSEFNTSGQSYIYIAIRRPHKPAENANDVFDAFTDVGDSGTRIIEGTQDNFIDFQISKSTGSTYPWYWLDRMQGSRHLSSNTESGNGTTQSSVASFDAMTGMRTDPSDGFTNESPWGGPYTRYHFTRAAKFFTIRPYTGNGQSRSISHDLGVVPELMIVKKRDAGDPWLIYHKDIGASKEAYFSNSAFVTGNSVWYNTPNATHFYTGNHDTINRNTNWMIAYLFASCPGISKVGSYTGTGNTIDIDCGFTNGARFVMIKRTDAQADWFVMSHNMGINTGNDPYLKFNTSNAQSSDGAADVIDPISSGFRVQTGYGAAINTSGGNYIYLAIA